MKDVNTKCIPNDGNTKKVFVASAIISELQASDIYLTIKARLLDLRANLNGVMVTEAFLDQIVEHQDKYICIPLCADVEGLISHKEIGHMYDSQTGEFGSAFIGSFYHFEKEIQTDEDGTNAYLVGYARVMKRNKAVCKALAQLFASGDLKFSFEITCGEYNQLEDGTIVIDRSQKNYLQGAATVTYPACQDAFALDLVAELKGLSAQVEKSKQNKKGDEADMIINDSIVATASADNAEVCISSINTDGVTTAGWVTDINSIPQSNLTVEPIATPTATVPSVEAPVDTAADCEKDEEEQDAACKKKSEEENAATEDPDEKKDEEQTAAQSDDEEKKDDEQTAAKMPEDEKQDEEQTAARDPEDKKEDEETASVEVPESVSTAELIESLRKEIAELRTEIQSMKIVAEDNSSKVIAEVEKSSDASNPFMAEMTLPQSQKFSLLEKEEAPKFEKYSLLDKA